jgi:ribonuclease HI
MSRNWAVATVKDAYHITITDKSFTSLTAAEAFVKSTAPLSSSSARKFYAVRRGHTPGIYTDWPSAQKQITGYNKPKFKSFSTRAEADSFIRAPSPSKSEPSEPPTKKRRSEGVTLPSEDTFNPYLKELPDDAEDSFDYSMKLDAETGQLRLKTKRELDALKVVPLPTSKAGETVKVWTDGACRANGQPGAAAGVGVWFGHQDPRFVQFSLTPTTPPNFSKL